LLEFRLGGVGTTTSLLTLKKSLTNRGTMVQVFFGFFSPGGIPPMLGSDDLGTDGMGGYRY
jgi:hypothetical protein